MYSIEVQIAGAGNQGNFPRQVYILLLTMSTHYGRYKTNLTDFKKRKTLFESE